MAFGKKYSVSKPLTTGDTITLEFYKQGYSGSVYSFDIDEPVFNFGGGNLEEPVSDIEINVPVVNDSHGVIKEIQGSVEGEWRIKAVLNGTDTFDEFYVLPDQCTYTKHHPNNIGVIKGSDLAILDAKYFTDDGTLSGNTFSGTMKMKDLLAELLNKLGYDLDLYIGYEWQFDATYSGNDITPDILDVPVEVYRTETERPGEFVPDKCINVLKDVLSTHGMNLRLGPGGFYAVQVELYAKDNFTLHQYSVSGSGATKQGTVSHDEIEWDDNTLVKTRPSTKSRPAVAQVETTYDFDFDIEFFDENGHFTQWKDVAAPNGHNNMPVGWEILNGTPGRDPAFYAEHESLAGDNVGDFGQLEDSVLFISRTETLTEYTPVLRQTQSELLGGSGGALNIGFDWQYAEKHDEIDAEKYSAVRVQFKVGDWYAKLGLIQVAINSGFEVTDGGSSDTVEIPLENKLNFLADSEYKDSDSTAIAFPKGTEFISDRAKITLQQPARWGDDYLIAKVEKRTLLEREFEEHQWVVREDLDPDDDDTDEILYESDWIRVATFTKTPSDLRFPVNHNNQFYRRNIPISLTMPDGTPIRGTREKTLYVPGRIDGPARKVLRGLYIDRFEIKPIGNLGPDESAIKTIAYYVDGGNRGVLQLPAHKIGEGPFDEANSALREASTGDLATDWDRGSSGNYTLDELNVSSWLALLAEPREIETNATYRTKSRVLYPATRIKDSDGYLLPIQAEFKPNSGTVSGQFIRVKKTNLTSSFTYQQGNDSASTAGSSDQAAAVVDLYGGGLGYEKASSTVAIIDTDYAAGTTINQLSVYEIQSENILDGDHFYILPALGGSPIKLSILTKPSKGDTTLDVASFDAPMGIEEGSIIITSKKALQTFVAQTDKSFSVTVRDEALTTLDQSISAGTSYDSLDVDFFPTTLGQVSQSV